MMSNQTLSSEHQEIFDLMPWYVNGTLADRERHRVDAHVRTCRSCRGELQREQRIHEAMAAEPGLEYIPAASFKRLQASLEGSLSPGSSSAADGIAAARTRVRHRLIHRSFRIAASVAALGLIAAGWMHWRSGESTDAYHTVTASTPRPADEAVRAVFAPNITLAELQAILDEAQLRIVGGPTEAGVYSLAATSHRPLNSSLALLRRHSSVRFAERTGTDRAAGSGESP
jgi:Putative zinc-finger